MMPAGTMWRGGELPMGDATHPKLYRNRDDGITGVQSIPAFTRVWRRPT